MLFRITLKREKKKLFFLSVRKALDRSNKNSQSISKSKEVRAKNICIFAVVFCCCFLWVWGGGELLVLWLFSFFFNIRHYVEQMLSCRFWFSVVGSVCHLLHLLTSRAVFSSLGQTHEQLQCVTLPLAKPEVFRQLQLGQAGLSTMMG